jgi:hypothetical protein
MRGGAQAGEQTCGVSEGGCWCPDDAARYVNCGSDDAPMEAPTCGDRLQVGYNLALCRRAIVNLAVGGSISTPVCRHSGQSNRGHDYGRPGDCSCLSDQFPAIVLAQ